MMIIPIEAYIAKLQHLIIQSKLSNLLSNNHITELL